MTLSQLLSTNLAELERTRNRDSTDAVLVSEDGSPDMTWRSLRGLLAGVEFAQLWLKMAAHTARVDLYRYGDAENQSRIAVVSRAVEDSIYCVNSVSINPESSMGDHSVMNVRLHFAPNPCIVVEGVRYHDRMVQG